MKFEGIKYGQDTSAYWNQAPLMKWTVSYNGTTFYTAAPAMPNSDLTIYGTSQRGSSTIHYYEYKNGQTTTIQVKPDYTVGASDWSFTSEDYIEIPGFTYHTSSKSGSQYYIYYTRNQYSLSFKNGSQLIDKGKFLYQADISGVIDSDDSLKNPQYTGNDPEGFTFAGWYTTEQCLDGTEWDPEGATMPANNVILYAKWAPVSHDVKLYITKEDWENGIQYLDTMHVQHNTPAQEPARPANGSYNFVGWFYMEDGQEKAFDFSIPVRKDLELYGRWYADELATYTIKYAVKNSDGTLTYIASDTKGNALAGYDKTFDAKTGTDLDPQYQSGYYPVTNSHNVPIKLGVDNTYTFLYVERNKVQYTVKYLEKDTNVVLHTEKVATTSEAIHTENFIYISGYRPNAYQQRLVLSANEMENVITFYYTKDLTHAPVLVKHYLQNAAGTGYNTTNPYITTTDLDAVINANYAVDVIQTLDGFAFSHAEASHEVNGVKTSVTVTVNGVNTQVSAVVTKEGLLIELYYDRVYYPYEFQFMLQGTNTALHAPIRGTAMYGSQVTQGALSIPGYTCQVANYAITIQIEDGTTAVKNIRIFYYVEQTVGITYVPVGGGTTTPGSQTNIPVLSGNVGGSTATPNAGYVFKGWFMDQACTIPVDSSWLNGNKITPAKTKTYGDVLGYESATYYAKFEEIKVTINYVVDGPVGCGVVTPGYENLGASTGTPNGSVAAPSSSAYKFVGWYSDADCTKLVSSEAEFVPTKNATALWVDGTTYYAKFEYNLTSLTINKVTTDKSGNPKDYTSVDDNQTFIFDIYDGNTLVTTVTVHAGTNWKIVIDGLTVGQTYRIVERTDWSWRYGNASWTHDADGDGNVEAQGTGNTATIIIGVNGTITFTNERNEDKWLDGDSWCDNIFKN